MEASNSQKKRGFKVRRAHGPHGDDRGALGVWPALAARGGLPRVLPLRACDSTRVEGAFVGWEPLGKSKPNDLSKPKGAQGIRLQVI